MVKPPSTPFGQLIDAQIERMGLNRRSAAKLAQMPTSTFSFLISGLVPGKAVKPENRAKIVALGIPEVQVEYAAALTAGYRVADPRCSAEEFRIVLKLRRLDPMDLESIEARIDYLDGRA